MIIDGVALADTLYASFRRSPIMRRLAGKAVAVCCVHPSDATKKFIAQKRAFAHKLGLDVRVYEYDETITQREFIKEIERHNANPDVCGIIVQLPLPSHLDSQRCFNAIDIRKDIDVMSDAAFRRFYDKKSKVMPPVAGAIDYIVSRHNIPVKNSFVVVLGAGRLVGMPCLAWCVHQGAGACSFRAWGDAAQTMLPQADIIIAGLGTPAAVKGDGLKDGVVVFDVGFSRHNGKVTGDVDFDSMANKASYLTPVPGGIGPLTVAMLFKNLIELQKEYKTKARP